VGLCQCGMAYAWVGGGGYGLYVWKVAANILNRWWGWGGWSLGLGVEQSL